MPHNTLLSLLLTTIHPGVSGQLILKVWRSEQKLRATGSLLLLHPVCGAFHLSNSSLTFYLIC